MLTEAGERKQSRRTTFRLRVLVLLGLLVAPVATIGLSHHLIQRQDAIAEAERHHQAAGLLAFFAHTQDVAVADNAKWDEAYSEIVVERNYDWFQTNIGAVQFGTMPHDAAAVIDVNGRTLAASYLGEETLSNPTEALPSIYQELVARARAQPASGPVGSFVSDGGQIAYLTISELRPEAGVAVPDRALLLFYYLLDDSRLASWRNILMWDDLSVSTDIRSATGFPILDASSTLIGSLEWAPPSHGLQALIEMAPLVLLVVALGVASILGLYLQVQKIAARLVAARSEALELAHHDPLTGVANRRLLAREIEAALTQGRSFQLMILDLDGFKIINDAYGHQAGDDLLVELSTRLARRVESEGLLARMGGDEFAIVRYGADADVTDFAKLISDEVALPIQVSGQPMALSASIGIATACEDLASEEIVRRADMAIYAAKSGQPGAIRHYDAVLDRAARQEAELGLAMRVGLKRGEFHVVYQPIFSVAEGRITAVEALARWQHPTEGHIPPDTFIPVAERSGSISELGAFVLREACAAFADTDLKVAVNLSPVQMLDPGFVAVVAEILGEARFAPERLEFEVTETTLIGQMLPAAEVMEALRRTGIGIALDDFGAGYASIGYVRRFPLDKIKIDRSLVASIAEDAGARDIVAAIVALCRALRVKITAEGVETRVQAELLTDMGCNLLQGWHIGRPASATCSLRRQVA